MGWGTRRKELASFQKEICMGFSPLASFPSRARGRREQTQVVPFTAITVAERDLTSFFFNEVLKLR